MTAALEVLPTGAALIDARGAIVFTNAAWQRASPATRGTHLREACGSLFGDGAAEAFERIGEVLAGRSDAIELAASGKDGAKITARVTRLTTTKATGALIALSAAERDGHGARDPYRAVVHAIPDLVIRVRRDGTVIDEPELTRASSDKATPQILDKLAAQSAMYVTRALRSRALKTGLCRLSVRGQVRDFETRVVPYGEDEALIIARDISDQTRTEEELQLFLGIALTTGDAVDLRSSLEVVMRLVCESTGWVVGQAWVPAKTGGLHCAATWLAHSAAALREFRTASEAGDFGPRGPSLPGSVFFGARATWIRDVTAEPTYERADAARAAGLKTGFAVPVLADTEVVAVLEFYAFEPRDEDERLLTMVSAVAEQIGSLMKRKRAEEAFRLLETAIQQMTESIVIATATTRSAPTIEFVSPAFSRMTGYAPEEVIGKTLDVLAGPRTDRSLIARARQETADGMPVEVENIYYRKDGSEIPLEWRVAPVRDQKGSVTHFVAVQRDITQRKQAEQARMELQRALETAARQWRLTFDAIESPIMLLANDGRLLRMNRAAQVLSGSGYKEQLSRPLDAIGDAEPWKKGAEVVAAALRSRGAVSSQVKDEKRGKTWDFSATLLDELDEEKVILVVRDITRLVELQESLRRSETMSVMGSLVAGVAHEVRNPLHAITVTLDAFEARFQIAPEHKRHIGVLRGEVARLTALMRDLLEYGKPAAPQFFEGSIDEVVHQAYALSSAQANDAGVTVTCRVVPDLPHIKIDPPRLTQVFQNLLENAIQHSKRGSSVTVSVSAVRDDDERAIECTVADDGPGFREADLPLVFKPFFTRRRGGTGLGLSIVSRIVDEHGGSVWASNRPEGGGLITVRLPLS
jgi:PAS domain S-box-containing protein